MKTILSNLGRFFSTKDKIIWFPDSRKVFQEIVEFHTIYRKIVGLGKKSQNYFLRIMTPMLLKWPLEVCLTEIHKYRSYGTRECVRRRFISRWIINHGQIRSKLSKYLIFGPLTKTQPSCKNKTVLLNYLCFIYWFVFIYSLAISCLI